MRKNARERQNLKAKYTALLPEIKVVAKAFGYAMAIHGSMMRDLDLVAVPWTDDATDADALADAVRRISEGIWAEGKPAPTKKPHGRLAYTIVLPKIEWSGGNGFIDLSVLPRKRRSA